MPYTEKGITPELSAAIGEDVHHLQALGGKKRERRVDKEQREEDNAAAQDHQAEREDLVPRPNDAALRDGVRKQERRLRQHAQAREVHLGEQNLRDDASGADEGAVKLAVAEHSGKGGKAAAKGLRQGEGHQHDRIAQEHLLVGKAPPPR